MGKVLGRTPCPNPPFPLESLRPDSRQRISAPGPVGARPLPRPGAGSVPKRTAT
jgi:hypothetical protein